MPVCKANIKKKYIKNNILHILLWSSGSYGVPWIKTTPFAREGQFVSRCWTSLSITKNDIFSS